MTALSIEEHLEKLEAQMQMRIERQNLLSELIYQQAKLQSTILYLSKMRESFLHVEPSFSPLLEQQRVLYTKLLAELPPEDQQGREYVRSLQNLFEQK
ncbi:Uncharacterised protein [Haemophilus influenzae]|uniref:Uncharacterized protein n=2 Tax=Haemophilus influenzae TaxID=727 RepID=A0ABD6WPQ4_HAEIF|nr:hypothetical protein [Haemophilus influenzae]AVJ00124.1 hypothetical protein BV121_1535 [Haemophilus influenzae]AVJ02161.1 hypothetical protein BV122_1730 [Haemophilus influenzae]AXP54790.1 hypothetical protein CH603_06690 [Haemophilus influenzae]AXP76311.1 hypothetical protein CH602_06340 [Haemophilus influenzae]KIP36686.1 hypothetical protein SU51_00340 [Haemophilus influenzae]